MDEAEGHPSELAASIAGADDARQERMRQKREAEPLPGGWAGLVERDRRARQNGHPNAAGGFLGILYPWRVYILAASAVLIPLLLITDIFW